MPKLPHVSDREAVRAFQKLGFEVSRQKGSHIIMKRGTDGCVIPNHQEIKVGTFSGRLEFPPTDSSRLFEHFELHR